MKSIVETLKNRRSYRDYNAKEVKLDLINESIRIAQRTATSVNGQHVSVVVTTDKKVLEEISKINWGQQHIKEASAFITFVVDFNRPEAVMNDEMIIQNDIESILVGAIDVGLLSQSVELLLQAQGIGTCQIGGIRNNIIKMNEILNIKGNAFAVLGMTVGNVDDFENDPKDIRPRVNQNTFLFNEAYDIEQVKQGALKYNNELIKWWEDRGIYNHRSYAESMNSFYTQYYMKDEFDQLQNSGFLKRFSKNDE